MAAYRVPEAMVKFISWGNGEASALAQLSYVAREGELVVALSDGTEIERREELRALVDEWAVDFHHRADGRARNTCHMMLSAAIGSDRDAVEEAARAWGRDVLGENWPYALVRHEDTDHPHVHVLIKVRGADGSRFSFDRDDLQRFREVFAERGRERGVDMATTPRDWRGAPRGESLALRKMREADREPEIDRVARGVLEREAANDNRGRGRTGPGGRERRRPEPRVGAPRRGDEVGRARQAKLAREAARYRALEGVMRGLVGPGPGGAVYARHAAALRGMAKHLEAGGELARPDRLRAGLSDVEPEPGRGSDRVYAEGQPLTGAARPSGVDLARSVDRAFATLAEGERIGRRMAEKLPPGAERERALEAAAILGEARGVLGPERAAGVVERGGPVSEASERGGAVQAEPEQDGQERPFLPGRELPRYEPEELRPRIEPERSVHRERLMPEREALERQFRREREERGPDREPDRDWD